MKRQQTALLLSLLLAACASVPVPAPKFAQVDAAIEDAIARKRIPGGVLHVERDGAVYRRAYGNRALVPGLEPMTEDTIFDAASITKAVATAPSVAKLVEQGKVSLDAPVRTYLGEYADPDVTVRHVLTHTSGIRPGLVSRDDWQGYDEGVRRALAEVPLNRPGAVFRYSDVNFIILGELVRRVSGEPLNVFARTHVFEPLGMHDTGFRPAQNTRIAPTENGLRGVVHDPTARRMGGVAGHAGLFTTAADLAKFARFAMTHPLLGSDITPPEVAIRRAFGLDLDSSYSRAGAGFAPGSFGHTGWTGGFLWIDPATRAFYIFLSNRVHPDGKGSVIALQRSLGTLVAEAVGAPGPRARRAGFVVGGGDAQNGIDVLHASGYAALRGKRIGLITNQSAIDRTGNPTVDLLRSAPDVKLVAVFTPEHGLRGTLDDERNPDEDFRGIPVYSLYGERRKPSPEQLAGLDALVFDVQDIGTRFYTYISTIGMAMEAAAEAKVPFVVLDRVNPIGSVVEGPMLEGKTNFTAWHPIPIRHGKTVGELAVQFREERRIDVQLDVVPVKDWKREEWQDEAGLPWVNTSPNMRSLHAAGLYPGIGIMERALSVGRGTPTPFEVLGAPYIDSAALIAAVGTQPGVRLDPTSFTPTASIHKDQLCHGVRFTITDRRALRSVDLGVTIASALARLYPKQFPVDELQPLLRHTPTLEAIRAGKSLAEIKQLWGLVLHDATIVESGQAMVADIVIRGDRIERVDSTHQHEGFRVIDTTGRYVIPGLIDMHAHLLLDFDRAFTEEALRMFLRYGVTTVRDPGSHLDILALRDSPKGPRILTAGPILIGSNFVHPQFKPVSTVDDVRAEIRAQAKAGVDMIKVYASMTPDLVRAAIDEAHAHQLPILGHLQRTTWADAARMGIDGIEHAAPWSNDLTTTPCPQTMAGRICWMENLDMDKAREAARVLKQHNVVVDPTLIAMQTKLWPDGGRDYSMLPPHVVEFWRQNSHNLVPGQPAWPRLLAFTKLLHDEGVTLVAGTDTPTPWIIPGLSLHEELQFLADAGIPNADILKIATLNAARALRRPDRGVIAPHMLADLVVLRKNPLEDIANTKEIELVVFGGRVVER